MRGRLSKALARSARRAVLLTTLGLAFALTLGVGGFVAIAAPPPLDRQFEQTVRPFINKHCAGCHSGATPAAQFDLKGYTSLAMVTRDYPRWALVLERLEAKDMPPKPMAQPSAESSHQVMEWIQALRKEELRKSAGPGLTADAGVSGGPG